MFMVSNNCLLFRLGAREKARESVQEGAVETILVATDRLFASTGDAAEMVRQARVLGQATAQLIQAIKVTVLLQKEVLYCHVHVCMDVACHTVH
jgi:hypothetical protein